jgi:hypothetical protein
MPAASLCTHFSGPWDFFPCVLLVCLHEPADVRSFQTLPQSYPLFDLSSANFLTTSRSLGLFVEKRVRYRK